MKGKPTPNEIDYVQVFVMGINPIWWDLPDELKEWFENQKFSINYRAAYKILPERTTNGVSQSITLTRTASDVPGFDGVEFDRFQWDVDILSTDAFMREIATKMKEIYGIESVVALSKLP